MALGFIADHPLLLIFVTIILLPFITNYLSTSSFYRRANNKTPNKQPPVIPYWIPGIFHGFGVFTQGTSAFFANAINEYGNFAPFVVKAGPLPFVVVRHPEHVKKVLQSVKQMTTTDLHVRIFDKVMGAPVQAVALYKAVGTGNKQSDEVDHAHITLPRQYFTGTGVAPMANVYIRLMQRNLSTKMFQEKFWTEIEDMWSFFQNEISRATIEMLFGSSLMKQYPKIVRDFWEFDQHVETLSQGLPRFLNSSAHEARDRLRENLQRWLESAHKGSDFAKIGEEDPDWDETMGSKFLQARDSIFANIPSFDSSARAAEALAIMQGSNSNTMPSTFWFIFETIKNPALVKHLRAEFKPYYDPATGTYDIVGLTNLPIIQSMHAEIGRLRMATGAIRTCEVDNFALDDDWTISKGTSVIVLSHDLALNTKLWAEARPQTVIRPLEEFWPERFLIPEKTRYSEKAMKDRSKIGTGRFSMEGVGTLHVTFGGGKHLCPGRYLAKAIQAATIALLLTEFDIELSEPEAADSIIPPLRQAAFGSIVPLDKIRVRIRKRTAAKVTKAS
ncbi:putative cytochrome-like protein P450 [Dendryphion nanum]|uniref:Cytochrome-like protein P450 n=1 Tax=Dendryphion nanum TaxID=256645 RepID=A0A9P9IVH7_9PLEO|nr:putative cytochrome-like protein P450 [Dendryphion nanum]